MDADSLRRLIEVSTQTVIAHAEELTALDQAIGDGDHGLNMKRGCEAVRAAAAAIAAQPLPEALGAIGKQLVMKVGGASGPLYGTLFLTLAKEIAPDGTNLAQAFAASVTAVMARGKSQSGQKTMLDVLVPVQAALAAGKSPDQLIAIAHDAAAATIPMQAIRGRASFLGERSIGHMDPGARSAALIISAIIEGLEA